MYISVVIRVFPHHQKRIEDDSRSCAVKTGAPLRSFSRFLASHLESIPARGTDAEGKAKLEVSTLASERIYISGGIHANDILH